jgi:hypothetical protein
MLNDMYRTLKAKQDLECQDRVIKWMKAFKNKNRIPKENKKKIIEKDKHKIYTKKRKPGEFPPIVRFIG